MYLGKLVIRTSFPLPALTLDVGLPRDSPNPGFIPYQLLNPINIGGEKESELQPSISHQVLPLSLPRKG
jgi:hypothetical protein